MISTTLYSSKQNTWETPQNLFDKLNDEFNFTLDVCAEKETAKCENYYTKEDNSLTKDWDQNICWANIPYGRGMYTWIEKIYKQNKIKNTVIVLLIPARTDTKYWHDFVMKASEIRFIKGRLKFGGATNSAPFPSAIIVFNNKQDLKVTTYEV